MGKKDQAMKQHSFFKIVPLVVLVLLVISVSAVACDNASHGATTVSLIETPSGVPSSIQAPQGSLAGTPEPASEPASEPAASPVPLVSRQNKLVAAIGENPDTVAWLYLPGTEIDDPVVQAADNDYYLQRTFEGEYSVWGCYFADSLNTLDSRANLDSNTVIYGHAYKNEDPDERKFTQLFKYLDPAFAEQNPYLYLALDGEDLAFQVAAVFFTDISFDYINPNPPQRDFHETIAAKNELLIDGLDFGPGDYVLTLSTCSHRYDVDNTRNHRLVVMAKLLPEGAAAREITITANPNPEKP